MGVGRRHGWRLVAVVCVLAGWLVACTAAPARSPAAAGGTAAAPAVPSLPGPLHTDGRWIVDRAGHRVKLVGVNWSGAETPTYTVGGLDVRPLDDIAATIAAAGFTSVRLPWSDQLVEQDPVVDDRYLAANPQLRGKRALDVLDAVVAALGRHGIVVVLDDHQSSAGWCCDTEHGNGLWYAPGYPESAWIADWRRMAARYRSAPNVVAAELRNEIRAEPQLAPGPTTPTWGDGDPLTDWRAAAQRAGDAVLAVDPRLLVVVGGVDFEANLTGAYLHPVQLSVPHRLVYGVHDYPAMHAAAQLSDYRLFGLQMGLRFGGLTVAGQPFTAPVWMTETGSCVQPTPGSPCPTTDAAYRSSLLRYLTATDLDVTWWQLDPTQGLGYGRRYGTTESYGLLRPDWSSWSDPALIRALQRLERPTQGPGVRG